MRGEIKPENRRRMPRRGSSPAGSWHGAALGCRTMNGTAADSVFMGHALSLAARAATTGEVPVGAVLVLDGGIVGEGFNQPIALHDPTAHAEIVALRAAGARLGAYRLPGSTMFVTLEPCPMCIGAMIHARVERLVFAASDPKTGACGGAMSLHRDSTHNHRIAVEGGLEGERAAAMLQEFFGARRGA
ncbi:tRNA adenosine(34) deaminase TadA [Spiribacter onubensis]|uniref:tRNA adenosine(34) deaminase TadA n=1 Tax=Spiribacter onubensis TaxID=3122420 RepID=UPI0038B427BC